MSSAIPPTGGQSSLANLLHSLHSARVRSANTLPASTQAARAASQATVPRDAADVSTSLAQVKTLLAQLDAQAAIVAGSDKSAAAQAQQRLDEISASIDGLVNRATTPRAASAQSAQSGAFTVSNVSHFVRKYSIRQATVDPGDSLDINVVITQSAQQGALFLSTGGALNLSAANAQFVIEIGGPKGATNLSFASGTTVHSIVTAINSLQDYTGVSAIASGTGFRLDTPGLGTKNFVSARIINDGGINQAISAAGIVQLAQINVNVASAATNTLFSTLAAHDFSFTDRGQDLVGNINGHVARGDGAALSVRSLPLTARITLTTPAAQSLGKFTAFTITGAAGTASSSLAQDIRSGLGLTPPV